MDLEESTPRLDFEADQVGAAAITITVDEAHDWLEGYKAAWESRDVEAALALFAPDAQYRERRFGEPLLGHRTLRSYWRDRVMEHQRDISFASTLWGVRNNELMARWQATFTWLPINGIMRIDGVMQVMFSERRDGRLLGLEFNEWFDQVEV